MSTVFISYSQKDKKVAAKVRATLEANGIRVTIDSESMAAGGNIRAFIDQAIRDTQVTLSIVSRNSLSSDWVALESIESFAAEKFLEGKKFIACYVDEEMFRDEFLIEAIDALDQQISELTGLIEECVKRNAPATSYETKKNRKLKLRNNLSDILERLNGSLTLDIREPEYDTSLQKIVTEILGNSDQRKLELKYFKRLIDKELLETSRYVALGGKGQRKKIEMRSKYARKPGQLMTLGSKIPDGPQEFDNAVEELMQIRRAVLLGEPGAGKTMTVWKLASHLIETSKSDPNAVVPLLIRLGEWTIASKSLKDFIADQLEDLGKYLDTLLDSKRAAILLDGLNELPTEQRPEKYPLIKKFVEDHPDLITIISCRENDFPIEMEFGYRIVIMPLDESRILDFVKSYLGDSEGENLFWRLAGGDEIRKLWNVWKDAGSSFDLFWTAEEVPRENPDVYSRTTSKQDAMWRNQVKTTYSLMGLARNPYLLLMLTSQYHKTGELPRNRGDLFSKFVYELFVREEVDETRQEVELVAISKLAFAMQSQSDEESGGARTVLTLQEAETLIGRDSIRLAQSASILDVETDVRFTHQLLQEYFAARHMDIEIKAGRLQASRLWPAEKWWERNNWEEATVLLAGLYNDDCTEIINWIADANPEVAVACIHRSGAVGTLEDLKRRWLPRLTDLKRDPDPRARAAVGRALAMTGLDYRPGVETKVGQNRRIVLPDIDWVRIPAGEFIYGYPGEKLTLGQFEISRYPLTYKQFQVFIDDLEGIRDARWFAGLTDDENEQQPGEQEFQFDNHPRERVSWYQAVAFCRWLSWRLGGEYALDRIDQWKVRLPTEQEWERAARGTDGRIYPYGNEFDASKANTYQTGIYQTSAVGIFPHGASPDGVMDMSGNVWEWCLKTVENNQTALAVPTPGTDNAPLRGGSWNNLQGVARAVYRLDFHPFVRDNDRGFRVVSVVRPPS
jgi:formylglycine-generating enzyme required for sulfatase activity